MSHGGEGQGERSTSPEGLCSNCWRQSETNFSQAPDPRPTSAFLIYDFLFPAPLHPSTPHSQLQPKNTKSLVSHSLLSLFPPRRVTAYSEWITSLHPCKLSRQLEDPGSLEASGSTSKVLSKDAAHQALHPGYITPYCRKSLKFEWIKLSKVNTTQSTLLGSSS